MEMFPRYSKERFYCAGDIVNVERTFLRALNDCYDVDWRNNSYWRKLNDPRDPRDLGDFPIWTAFGRYRARDIVCRNNVFIMAVRDTHTLYISRDWVKLKTWMPKKHHLGTWSPSLIYYKDEMVVFRGWTYVNTAEVTRGLEPWVASSWMPLDGVAYDINCDYYPGAQVMYHGRTYECTTPITRGTSRPYMGAKCGWREVAARESYSVDAPEFTPTIPLAEQVALRAIWEAPTGEVQGEVRQATECVVCMNAPATVQMVPCQCICLCLYCSYQTMSAITNGVQQRTCTNCFDELRGMRSRTDGLLLQIANDRQASYGQVV